jgi:hypothetical protein
LLLITVVDASENVAVARASGDLNLGIRVTLGAGFVSMMVVGTGTFWIKEEWLCRFLGSPTTPL